MLRGQSISFISFLFSIFIKPKFDFFFGKIVYWGLLLACHQRNWICDTSILKSISCCFLEIPFWNTFQYWMIRCICHDYNGVMVICSLSIETSHATSIYKKGDINKPCKDRIWKVSKWVWTESLKNMRLWLSIKCSTTFPHLCSWLALYKWLWTLKSNIN